MWQFKLLLVLFFTSLSAFANSILTPDLPLQAAQTAKPMAKNKLISFIVWLKVRNKEALDELSQEVYDPQSPQYQHFLTADRYEQEFAPSKDIEEKISQFFSNQGMKAQIINHSIRVKGTVAQIKQSLRVSINEYSYQNQIFYANTHAPQMPSDLASYINEITGLDNLREFQADLNAPQPLAFISNNFIPTAHPTDRSLSGFSGAELQKTYKLNAIPAINGVPLDGAGQTLVIIDKCGTNTSAEILRDANQYFQMNGIKPFITSGPLKNFAVVKADGEPYSHCPGATAYSQEIILDVEAAHTLAPGGNTVLVLGESRSMLLSDVIHELIQNNYTIAGFTNAYIISNSWGGAESYDPGLETTLQLAATSGISVNFSSGDCGDNTYNNGRKCTGNWPTPPTVNFPASSAFVTAVGGTTLFVDHDYRYAFETVWGNVKLLNGVLSYDGGTGGGISLYYGPVSWQNPISNFTAGGYGLLNSFNNMRAIPDISMLGDPETGLLIISQGTEVKDGGTSLSCPLFSATLLLVNQARYLLNRGTPIGQAAPYLYLQNNTLLTNKALHLIVPPARIIDGATPPPPDIIQGTPAPASAFSLHNTIFGWDSSLTVEPENQFWNDSVGVGSPNLPNFVITMANL